MSVYKYEYSKEKHLSPYIWMHSLTQLSLLSLDFDFTIRNGECQFFGLNIDALPEVWRNRGRRAFISGKGGSKGLKRRRTGKQRQFWGPGNIKMKILILGNRVTKRFISGEQGNRYPVGGP